MSPLKENTQRAMQLTTVCFFFMISKNEFFDKHQRLYHELWITKTHIVNVDVLKT